MNEKIKQINPYELIGKTWKNVGFEKYAQITKTFQNVNVLESLEFQRRFNGFYRVRRNKEWQKKYYTLMQQGKKEELSFDRILRELYLQTGRVEASFASKLLHTINNDMPIWDKFVLQNLGLKMPVCYGEKKIENAILIYKEIISWYKNALSIPEINQKMFEFDEIFPDYKYFSKTKKLDFLLWQMRENNP